MDDGSCLLLVWDRGDRGFFSLSFSSIPIQFPFPLSQTKLIGIGNIFDNRQHTVNCSLRFFFFTGTRNDQTIEIMTGKARATGKPELPEKTERPD
jgi:hypothetical protein